ncbi:Hypothetical predicted protein [Podarcis lilfordi]|uniref:Uncharacterized protein n=1 Tax=Podarcis lilfordi TaxID=74358 RepID=A0AA35K997_9SAUR|nr:Hypothetical predicted protein [Podarcis lilfordi]
MSTFPLWAITNFEDNIFSSCLQKTVVLGVPYDKLSHNKDSVSHTFTPCASNSDPQMPVICLMVELRGIIAAVFAAVSWKDICTEGC